MTKLLGKNPPRREDLEAKGDWQTKPAPKRRERRLKRTRPTVVREVRELG